MAMRRMISKQIVSSDDYLSLSFDAQALYIQLTIDADEFGFTTGVNRIRRSIGADEASVDELEHERFIIRFESGAVVIRHWFLANFGLEFNKSNRSLSTNYLKELSTLDIDEDGAYVLSDQDVAAIREQQIKSGRLNPNQLKVMQYIFKAEHVDDKNKSGDQGTGQNETTPGQTANPALNDTDEQPEAQEPTSSPASVEDEFDQMLSKFAGFTKDELNEYKKVYGDERCKSAMQRAIITTQKQSGKPTLYDFLRMLQ